MKDRRTPLVIGSLFFLFTFLCVAVASPAFSSTCGAGQNCLTNAVVELQRDDGLQTNHPRGALLATAGDCPSSFEERVILLINVERARAGLQPLQLDIRLQDAARWFANDIALNGFQPSPHNDSRGYSPEYRVKDERGYDFDYLGETAIAGWGVDNNANTPEEVVAGWMASPGHHDILLSSLFEHIGVGYVHLQNEVWDDVTVADFASPQEPEESRLPPLSTCDPGFYQTQFPIVLK